MVNKLGIAWVRWLISLRFFTCSVRFNYANPSANCRGDLLLTKPFQQPLTRTEFKKRKPWRLGYQYIKQFWNQMSCWAESDSCVFVPFSFWTVAVPSPIPQWAWIKTSQNHQFCNIRQIVLAYIYNINECTYIYIYIHVCVCEYVLGVWRTNIRKPIVFITSSIYLSIYLSIYKSIYIYIHMRHVSYGTDLCIPVEISRTKS